MTVPLWGWLATLAGVGMLVAVDIRQARRPHEVAFREASTWSLIYVGAAVLFGAALAVFAGGQLATAYFAGYPVEKSLSVDNLFVFAVILTQFAVPARHQQRVLLLGVLGALVLRAAFIAAGAAVVQRFTVTTDYRHGKLLTRVDGRRAATPLLVVVVAILSVDILFALDSIPAIFGIIDSAYLVFTANAFALLRLRALYFLLVGLLDRLVHLHYGLAVVLGFIGVKLVLHYAHSLNAAVPEISTVVSLLVVIGVLAAATVTSVRASRNARPIEQAACPDVQARDHRRASPAAKPTIR